MDCGGAYPVHGAVEENPGVWIGTAWKINGDWAGGIDASMWSLAPNTKILKAWVVIYTTEDRATVFSSTYGTQEQADKFRAAARSRHITTIPIIHEVEE